ncbi:MAG: hypothetical protein O7H41_09095 [Planctomycetota bacterium]|nr:hypothetical protein [Planctomycetota bacterium]
MKLVDFIGIHEGASIVVCGCGESLNDFVQPERFVTIGVNDIGRRFQPDYLIVLNPLHQFSPERLPYIERSQSRSIFTHLDLKLQHSALVKVKLGTYGGTSFSDPPVLHYTQNSPYPALCLAMHMGAARIGLIGVDFTENHFYAETGRHSLAGQLPSIDEEYRRLGEAARNRGVDVYNLSRKSRLSAFPSMTVDEFHRLQVASD